MHSNAHFVIISLCRGIGTILILQKREANEKKNQNEGTIPEKTTLNIL